MGEEKNNGLIKEIANNRLYTYGDYLKWTDEQRYELINGKIYLLSPAPSRSHQEILVELLRQFSMYLFDKGCKVYTAPFDVRLPDGEEEDRDIQTVVQPDILVICDEDKLDKRGYRGAPELIIEIISPSSGVRDRKEKRNLYEKHGVKEYWLVDYNEKTVEVYLLGEKNDYSKPLVYSREDEVSVNVLNGLEINLSYVFQE